MLRTVVSRALASRAPAAARAGGNTAWRHTRLMSTEEEPATLAAGAEGEEGEFAPSDEIKFESSEPRYMTTLTFSEAGLQAMIKKDIDREKVRPQTREFGGIHRSRRAIPEPRSVYAKFHVVRQHSPETHHVAPVSQTQSAAKIIGLLGGRLQSYHVTTTGDANAVVTYTFPKNHNVQTLLYTLMASGSYSKQRTVKLMTWEDAAMSLKQSRAIYANGGVSCNLSLAVPKVDV